MLKEKFLSRILVAILISIILILPETLAIHFWSPIGFSVSRVGTETFDTLTNFSKQGAGCSIINNQLNCPANSGVTYAPQPNPDGNALPNLSTNTNNFTIEWDMQILSCVHGFYPALWGTSNDSVGGNSVAIHYNDNVDSMELRNQQTGSFQTINDLHPDNTWQHYKATFYENSSIVHSVSIAINGGNKANIAVPKSGANFFDPTTMVFQYLNDDCSINADNLTMYNGTIFPFEIIPQNPTLTVIKIVFNNDTGIENIADFTLKINDTIVTSGVPVTLAPGVYQVSEVQDVGYNSIIAGDCDSNGSISLNQGDNKTCIITNDDVPVIENSTLTLIKIVVNNDTCKLTSSNFILRINDTAVEEGVPIKLQPGVYRVNEVQNLNYVASFLGDCDSSGNIILGEKQNKTCIILNDDFTPGIIKGTKFKDINGNGVKDINDTGLQNWIIYIDSNNNGRPNSGEKSVLTGMNGTYALKGLGIGTYTIREFLKSGWNATLPLEGKYTVTINSSGSVITNIDFGNRLAK